jgi:hypothetical protein
VQNYLIQGFSRVSGFILLKENLLNISTVCRSGLRSQVHGLMAHQITPGC